MDTSRDTLNSKTMTWLYIKIKTEETEHEDSFDQQMLQNMPIGEQLEQCVISQPIWRTDLSTLQDLPDEKSVNDAENQSPLRLPEESRLETAGNTYYEKEVFLDVATEVLPTDKNSATVNVQSSVANNLTNTIPTMESPMRPKILDTNSH